MTELSYFAEPDISRTGAAPPPDTLVGLLALPRKRLSPVTPAAEPLLLDLPAARPVARPAARVRFRLRVRFPRPAVGAVPPPIRIALVAATGAAAAAPSIGALLSDARAERPGARLLVALLAGAAVLGVRARRPFHEPDIHDRDVDWLLALPLLAVAGFFVTSVADRIGPAFGSRHLSLLTVPLLVAAATVLCFGTRAMWRLRLPLALLLLSLLPWPQHGQAASVAAASRLLRAAAEVPAAVGVPVQRIDPTPWLAGPAGVAGLLAALLLLSGVIGPRVVLVAAAWALLAVLRTATGTALPAPVADAVTCLVLLATAAVVVRRTGRVRQAPASRRLAPIARCLDVTAVRLRGTSGE